MASTPGYFKIYNSENKEWLYIKLHSRRANGTFEIQNYVRTDAKNKNEGQVLITMGEAKRTEFKLGKELGEGEDFYTRGPMMIYKHEAMKKKIGEEATHDWGKYSCYDFRSETDNHRSLKGNGQTYGMKYQVKSEAPFTMQDGAVYTLTCEETGWLKERWVICTTMTKEGDDKSHIGNMRYPELDRENCEQTWTLVDAHGKTMHTWKNPVNYKPRKPNDWPAGFQSTEDGCNAPDNLTAYKQLQATSEAPGLHKSKYMHYKETADAPTEGDGSCGCRDVLEIACMIFLAANGGDMSGGPSGDQSHMSVMVEDGADAVLALAVAYAMAENCVAIGPVPNTREQDRWPSLKQKKKNAKDEVMGCKELFERGLPDGYYFKPTSGITGVGDPYKGMTPWEITGYGSPHANWTGKTMK